MALPSFLPALISLLKTRRDTSKRKTQRVKSNKQTPSSISTTRLMKRQSSSSSSSSPSTNHHSIGCISGLFHLLSTYPLRRRHRKSITSGKKQDRAVNVMLKPALDSEPATATKVDKCTPSSRDVPRSPTLRAEIRSPAAAGLVAKLMGLDHEVSVTPAEKRRILMGALEKCDEDLKALKGIIQVVKMSSVAADGADNNNNIKDGSFSPPSSVALPAVNTHSTQGRSWPWQQQRKSGEEGVAVASQFTERITESVYDAAKRVSPGRPSAANKDMAESVEQVCRDIEWGEKREVGRIGLALQDYICRDLIEEIVKDMGRRRNTAFKSLPLEACKRRLSF